ncbi:hypothetical protein HETIRDRAFT_450331 [Heterobasidion irregulare TC 32-1]|uniref:Uncharacterized protein n=1 Tax=Heterobasidion irregulare (strain TC 32-1) TaxID=747525 RepID=W4KBL9_HETIT|nr:uncharacterized protein HETIRDRAFT_450331 [Heterobasidion irregulare TC 32-1]ETW82461.1 hypothetical protein HETIRDRAFT_450331 [Heterobasidion irregulare TC 32-1]
MIHSIHGSIVPLHQYPRTNTTRRHRKPRQRGGGQKGAQKRDASSTVTTIATHITTTTTITNASSTSSRRSSKSLCTRPSTSDRDRDCTLQDRSKSMSTPPLPHPHPHLHPRTLAGLLFSRCHAPLHPWLLYERYRTEKLLVWCAMQKISEEETQHLMHPHRLPCTPLPRRRGLLRAHLPRKAHQGWPCLPDSAADMYGPRIHVLSPFLSGNIPCLCARTQQVHPAPAPRLGSMQESGSSPSHDPSSTDSPLPLLDEPKRDDSKCTLRSGQTHYMCLNVSTRRARASWWQRDKTGKGGLIVMRLTRTLTLVLNPLDTTATCPHRPCPLPVTCLPRFIHSSPSFNLLPLDPPTVTLPPSTPRPAVRSDQATPPPSAFMLIPSTIHDSILSLCCVAAKTPCRLSPCTLTLVVFPSAVNVTTLDVTHARHPGLPIALIALNVAPSSPLTLEPTHPRAHSPSSPLTLEPTHPRAHAFILACDPLIRSRALLAHLLTSVDSTPVQPLSLTPTFGYGQLFAISHLATSSLMDLVSKHTVEAKTSGIEGWCG